MNRLRFPLLLAIASGAALISAVTACGGISDPTKQGASEPVATVSGALTGTTVPAGAHVALVWRVGKTGGYAVGNDVAVVNGGFTMNLTVPPSSYFVEANNNTYDSLSGGGSTRLPSSSSSEEAPSSGNTPAPTASVDASAPSSGGSSGSSGGSGMIPAFDFSANVHPKDTVSGTITQPLTAAIAGFVVYVDANGNNQLDLTGEYASSPDQIIGGNKELLLTYLQDGGALDYEKLRDRSGILPKAGYNLAWDQGRWLPLNVVELKISSKTKLPGAVCESSGISPTTDFGGDSAGPSTPPSRGGAGTGGSTGGSTWTPPPGYYPPSNDPKLHCSDNGYSWTYDGGWGTCPTYPPPPTGLCASDYGEPTIACVKQSGSSLDPDANPTAPSGWPCPITISAGADASAPPPIDAGPGPSSDAGI